MKIVIFVEYLPPHMGSDYRIYQIAKGLIKLDFDVSFIVFPPLRALGNIVDDSLKKYLDTREQNAKDENLDAIFLGIPFFLQRVWSKSMPLAYLLSLVYFYREGLRILKRLNPDIVVAAHPSYLCGLVGITTAKELNIPTILDYPDLWTQMTTDTLSWSRGGVKFVVLEGLENIPLRIAKHTIVVSDFIYDRLVRKGINKTKITLVTNGVSPREIEPRLENIGELKNPHTILFVGRLERWSGVDQLLKAIFLVLKTIPESKLLIVGDGSYKKSLEDLAGSLGINRSVKFTGFLKRELVWNFIRDSNICVSIFSEGYTNDAAIPIKLLEYMAFGKPIVTTEVKGMASYLKNGENVLLVDCNPERISEAILYLLRNPEKASCLGFNAEKVVRENFDWASLAKDVTEVFDLVSTK